MTNSCAAADVCLSYALIGQDKVEWRPLHCLE
jgi:hypothetical protein